MTQPKYRITVVKPRWYHFDRSLTVTLEKYDGRKRKYVPVPVKEIGVRDARRN